MTAPPRVPARSGLLDRLLPPTIRHAGPDTVRRARLLVRLCVAIGAWGPLFAAFF